MFRRSGFSLVELLVASLVLAIGLLGIFALTQTTAVNTFHDEFRVLAMMRARRLVQGWLALDPAVRRQPRGSGSNEVANPFTDADGQPVPASYGSRAALYKETLILEPAGPPGLELLTVRVEWEFPAQHGGGKHDFQLKRVVAREDFTLREEGELKRE